uniref:Uncharacterized protein n=1 Tax=Chrysemys picta bellii TaxID=8478 RepID=A0A8C3HBJ2_CHRPI
MQSIRAGQTLCLQCTTSNNNNNMKRIWQAVPHPGSRHGTRSQEISYSYSWASACENNIPVGVKSLQASVWFPI